MISLHNISVGYGKKVLIDDVDISIPSHRLVALIGRNGSGKSTLLRALSGIDKPLKGHIEIEGKDMSSLSSGEIAKTVSIVTTGRVRIADMRCSDVVALGRAPYTDWIGRIGSDDRKIVEQSLEAVGMTEYASRMINTLSDGEMQRVMIARALAQATPLMLLDEPTSFLDLPGRYEICMLLKRLAHEHNRTVIFSTHELDIAMRICDDIILVDTPSLIYGSVPEIVESGAFKRIFGPAVEGIFSPC